MSSGGSKKVMTTVDLSYWEDYHVYVVDWKEVSSADIIYDFYLDVKMYDGDIVNLTGIKRYVINQIL